MFVGLSASSQKWFYIMMDLKYINCHLDEKVRVKEGKLERKWERKGESVF